MALSYRITRKRIYYQQIAMLRAALAVTECVASLVRNFCVATGPCATVAKGFVCRVPLPPRIRLVTTL